MDEQWKDINRYEGVFEVSNRGRIRFSITNIIKQPYQIGKYLLISLKGTEYRVHRLVAKAFIDNPDNLPIVHHRDDNSLNNEASNLLWCTQSEHISYIISRYHYGRGSDSCSPAR